ncbi:TerD family protein [Variovorax sp. RCC_210]|uniref:TerD family protein n=1 Tax=Variovorax sp. RCC_210 TaxID=3239217 RepID=UPI003523866D
MNESIYLRRRWRVLAEPGQATLPPAYLATLYKELEALGCTLSPSLDACLCTWEPEPFVGFHRTLLKNVRALKGAHREWKPLYPNFPEQVASASATTLLLNAVRHYASFGRLRPDAAAAPRDALPEEEKLAALRVIDLGTPDDFHAVFTQLAGARSSLSVQDKEDLAWFVRFYRGKVHAWMPEHFVSKENLAVLGAALLKVDDPQAQAFLEAHLQTATDVLRLAVACSDGDVSLAEPAKFARMKRPLRRWLLALMERSASVAEDVARRPEVFKRLGEVLHPGEHAKRFPAAAAAFENVRNGVRPQGFNHHVERQLEARAIDDLLALLPTRPGDFARRLDHVLRLAPQPREVLARFGDVADKASTAVLLQAMVHFGHRDRPDDRPGDQPGDPQGEPALRSFFPKGDTAKVFAVKDTRLPLPPGIAQEAAALCEAALLRRFAQLPLLGRCHVEPALRNHLVPFSQRSASKALRTLVRGSRLPMPNANIVRLFLWWKNGRSRTDIDLSAALFTAQYKYIDVLAYYNLKSYGGVHSGDIVDAPKGAAEFIDLDVALLREKGVRYVMGSISSFTSQAFCDLPECFAGWMARQAAGSGEIFEPATVIDRVDVAADTTICLPAIFDLEAREVIWADIALKQSPLWNNVQSNLAGVSLMLRSLVELAKPDLHTLFMLHARARGQLVEAAGEADTVFGVHQGVTPFDTDRIRADFM